MLWQSGNRVVCWKGEVSSAAQKGGERGFFWIFCFDGILPLSEALQISHCGICRVNTIGYDPRVC